MAISLVGLGSPAYGNNAAVAPTLPTGLQAGDLLVAVTSIRANAGRFNIPTGWTEITFEAPGTTICVQVFYRWWQSGDGNPSFTVKTGASNATTIGQVFGLRGVDATTPFVKGDTTQYRWDSQPDAAASTLYKDGSGNRPSLPAGYAVLHVGSYTNDTATPWSYAESFTPTSATRVLNHTPLFTAESALGSDSSLAASLTSYSVELKDPANGTATYLTTQLSPAITTTGGIAASYVLKFGVTTTTYTYTGSGGAKAGGVATTRYSPANTYTGSGGAKAGGAATTSYEKHTFTYTGSGGAKAGGAATTATNLAGVQIRDIGTPYSRTTALATLRCYKPTNAQVGDMWLIAITHKNTGGNSVPNAVSGFNLYSSNAGNGPPTAHFLWKQITAGDPSYVDVTLTNDIDNDGKYTVSLALYNIDWTANGGVPVGPGYTYFEAMSFAEITLYLGVTPSNYNSTFLIHATQPSAGDLSLTTDGSSNGWVIDHQGQTGTDFTNSHMAIGHKYTYGNRADLTSQSYKAFKATTVSNYAVYSIVTIASAPNGTDHLYTGSGGAKAGGAATTSYVPKPAGEFIYFGSGGAKAGGAADLWHHTTNIYQCFATGGALAGGAAATQIQHRPYLALYQMSSTWDAQGVAFAGAQGWRVYAVQNGVKYPVSQVTSRMKAGEYTLMLKMPGQQNITVGQNVSLNIVSILANGQEVTLDTDSATVTSVIASKDMTTVDAFRASTELGGADWSPVARVMESGRMIRVAVDWFVMPGDRYAGSPITEVTTTMGTYSPWFTEVSYG